MSSIDVLIVGAGPVGLTAALALVQSGLTVRIIDKLPPHLVGQRGAGLVPRTLEAFHFLGLLQDVKKTGGPMPPMQTYNEDGTPRKSFMMIPRVESTPDIPEPNHILLGQDSTANILRKHLDASGMKVEVSTELLSLEQDAESVTATIKREGAEQETVRAKILYGTDGAKGVTRKLVNAPFLGESPDMRQMIGDIALTGIDREHWHLFRNEKENTLMLRPAPDGENLFFFVCHGKTIDIPAALADEAVLLGYIRETSHNSNIEIADKGILSEWRLNVRMVDNFNHGRVLLAGDAAHCHSPAGGQGLNSGIMDVMNSTWKAALVCKGLAPLSLLDTYTVERVPVIQEMCRLQMTTGILKNFRQTTGNNFSLGNPLALRQLGVHCRWSPIVRDELNSAELENLAVEGKPAAVSAYGTGEAAERLHAGDRAPDATTLVGSDGKETRLFEIFSHKLHTVLVFDTALAQDVAAIVTRLPKGVARAVAVQSSDVFSDLDETVNTFTDREGHAARAYCVQDGVKAVVVRPDGVVGALLLGVEGLDAYFANIFSSNE